MEQQRDRQCDGGCPIFIVEMDQAIIEQRVRLRVEREIAEANERLLAAGRTNPANKEYQRHKAILRYSYDHNMSLPEARAAWMAIERKCGRRINDLETLQKTQ